MALGVCEPLFLIVDKHDEVGDIVKERAVLVSGVMQPQEPLTITLAPAPLECWDDESTASALRALAVRLHSTGISLRETATALEQFGVTRFHQAVFQWVHRVAEEVPDLPTARVVCVRFEY